MGIQCSIFLHLTEASFNGLGVVIIGRIDLYGNALMLLLHLSHRAGWTLNGQYRIWSEDLVISYAKTKALGLHDLSVHLGKLLPQQYLHKT